MMMMWRGIIMPHALIMVHTDSAGRVHLKNENWVAGGTASIMRGRHVLLQSGDQSHAGHHPTHIALTKACLGSLMSIASYTRLACFDGTHSGPCMRHMHSHSMWPNCGRGSAEHTAPASAVLDFGLLTDAIHVSTGAHLEFQRLHVPNSGNRKLKHPSQHTRLHVAGAFALWPSVTLAQGSKVGPLNCSAAVSCCMLATCILTLPGQPSISLRI